MLDAYVAADVRAAEEPLLAAGPPGALMERAAFALATHVLRELARTGRRVVGRRALALVGGGNNGGDALHAVAFLARRGVAATAALLTPRPHPGGLHAARSAGVRVLPLDPAAPGAVADLVASAQGHEVWIDGIAGIGATGPLRRPVADAVATLAAARAAAEPRPLVVAVDTPSGIGVDDGALAGPVLPADVTVTMGVAKPGLLLPPAASVVGRVHVVDIGLVPTLGRTPPAVRRLEAADVAALWPVPSRRAHKYDRGVLGVVAGSGRYPGAGVLVAAGACATGAGMVRYLGEQSVLRLVLGSHPEVVGAPGRVQAWAFGSGVEPDGAGEAGGGGLAGFVGEALRERLPAVLDAGALTLLDPAHPHRLALPLHPGLVLTPHAGELARLLSACGQRTATGGAVERADVDAAPSAWARAAARVTGATVLLKGPVTVVAAPDGTLFAQEDATAWLATAGAGDVLAGVLGALLAGRSDDVRAEPTLAAALAAAAAAVHGAAARAASAGGPIAAGDVARHLPAAVRSVLATH